MFLTCEVISIFRNACMRSLLMLLFKTVYKYKHLFWNLDLTALIKNNALVTSLD